MNSPAVSPEAVWEALREVMDPELGCNIVDLGLVYSVEAAGRRVAVAMTLTTPGCPMQECLVEGVRTVLHERCGLNDAEVRIVWEPRWNPAMMSEDGRKQTGIFA